jgi:molybdate transport system substrate-binding protein
MIARPNRSCFLALIGTSRNQSAKRVFALVCFATSLLATLATNGEQARSPAHKLLVASASDLQFALEEIIKAFESENSSIQIEASYGSSGNFRAQIENGAPFDLYLSADIVFPRMLIESKRAVPDSLFLYGVGAIVVWVPTDSRIDLEKHGISSLLDPSVRKIAIANPQHAPYGRAAIAAMKQLGVYEKAADKLVFGENIAQATQFVQSGSADIGIIALSLAMAPKLKDQGRYWKVPLAAFPRIEQGGVIVASSKQLDSARAFRSFLLGEISRDILNRYGFIVPK